MPFNSDPSILRDFSFDEHIVLRMAVFLPRKMSGRKEAVLGVFSRKRGCSPDDPDLPLPLRYVCPCVGPQYAEGIHRNQANRNE